MNGCREDSSCCYFHPKVVSIGVCHLCLNERLVILAAKQGHRYNDHHHRYPSSNQEIFSSSPRRTPLNLPKIFALGSLFNRFEFRHWKHSDKSDVSTSPEPEEESFISIKFGDNGAASWEKGKTTTTTVSELCLEKSWINNQNQSHMKKEVVIKQDNNINNNNNNKETMSVIEHAKPRGMLRWRKRIGHMFQVIRLKRSSKGNMCHMGTKVEGVKVMSRKGWIRSLTKRKTKE